VSVNPPKTTSCSTCLAESLKNHVGQNKKYRKPEKHHHKRKLIKLNNDDKRTI
jgi:hypothetical protein